MPSGKSASAASIPIPPPPPPPERALEVRVHWGDRLLEVQSFSPTARVTAGHLPEDDVQVFSPALGGGFPLIVPTAAGPTLRVPPSAKVTWGGSEPSPSEGAPALAVDSDVRIALGQLVLSVGWSPRAEALPSRSWREGDFTFFKVACVAMMGFAAGVAMMTLTPRGFSESLDVVRAPERRPPAPTPVVRALDTPPVKEPTAATSRGPSRTARGPSARTERGRTPVGDMGLLQAFKQLGGGVLGGGSSLEAGINAALRQLKGAHQLSENGFAGIGTRGVGPGIPGGGLGIDGPLGTRGGGPGGFSLSHRARGVEGPRPIPGRTTVVGGLDREEVARVVRKHQREIKYCYERELGQNPGLAGKVSVLFTIDPSGSVSEAEIAESSLGSPSTEACMLSRMRRWRFPEPAGGGVVSVTLPWLFATAGSSDEE